MTLLEQSPTSVKPQEAEALFKEARQRRRRLRMFRSIFVVAIVAAVLVLGFALHVIPGPGSPSHPSDSRPTPVSGTRSGATLVYAYNNLQVINADTGASRSLPLPAPQDGSSVLSVQGIGGSLLLNRDNTLWLYRPGLLGLPVNLGPSHGAIPGPTANEAWIWSDRCATTVVCSNDGTGLSQGELRLVDTSGNQIGAPISLPDDATWFPTGDVVNAGLVLAVASIGPDAEEIWNPITNHVVHILPGVHAIASSGNLVAWDKGKACLPHCTVQLTNVETGTEKTFQLPTGATLSGGAAFSPDGSTLALSVGIGGTWPGTHPAAVALMDLRTQEVRLLPGTEMAMGLQSGPQTAFWSSSGWLFVAAFGGPHVLAWRPGEQRAIVLPKVRLPPVSLEPPQFQPGYPTLLAM